MRDRLPQRIAILAEALRSAVVASVTFRRKFAIPHGKKAFDPRGSKCRLSCSVAEARGCALPVTGVLSSCIADERVRWFVDLPSAANHCCSTPMRVQPRCRQTACNLHLPSAWEASFFHDGPEKWLEDAARRAGSGIGKW